MEKTAMQKHIEWLEDTIEIAEQQAPTLVNTLNLCLNDAKHRLIMEKEQIIKAHGVRFDYRNGSQIDPNVITGEQYYNETFKSE